MLVEIWSDVVCPWCYLGKRRFEKALATFDHADAVQIRWRSFELDPTAPARRREGMAAHLAAKYGMPLEQATARLSEMDALAAADGLAYDLAATKGGNTFKAHQLVHLGYAASPALGAAAKEALLHAYFVELAPIGETDTLLAAAVAAGIAEDEAAAVLAEDRFGAEVRRDEQTAAELGCTGVPFFVFDRALAVAGAQSVETFGSVLEEAWRRRVPEVSVVAQGDVCTDDACAL